MFHTRVQIWFQLEFPCNVPNLIKLMRVFFPAISTGFPVSVPTSSAQPCTQEARTSAGNKRSRSIPATPFAAGHWAGVSGQMYQRWPVATLACLPHALPFPVPQCSLCSGMVRELDSGIGARKVAQVKKGKLNRNCVCYQAWRVHADIIVMGNGVTPTYRSSSII